MNKTLLVVGGIAVIAVAAIGGLAYMLGYMPGSGNAAALQSASSDEASPSAAPLLPPREPPQGYKEFRQEHYRFSLFYPQDLEVSEFDEGSGARTIVFQNTETAKGFQIFVVPYAAEQVTPERFKKDLPSGVRDNPLDITIGGAAGMSFFSKSPLLGDTAEVWFIHGGYLFEVTAPKSEAEWLSAIMQTWQFI